jgi:hypothetical protein
MRKWSFEVRNGALSELPQSLQVAAEQQRSAKVHCFFVSEGGTLLNEPDESLVASITSDEEICAILGQMSKAMAWVFGRLELELDQDFRFNYLKLSFVNLNPKTIRADQHTGKMTTNAPELPEGIHVSADMTLRQMTTTLRLFFSHVQGAVKLGGWDTEVFACDWVSMTFNKA